MEYIRQGRLCPGSSQRTQTRVRVEVSGVLSRSSTSSSHEQGKARGPTEGLSQRVLLKPVPGVQERWGTPSGY